MLKKLDRKQIAYRYKPFLVKLFVVEGLKFNSESDLNDLKLFYVNVVEQTNCDTTLGSKTSSEPSIKGRLVQHRAYGPPNLYVYALKCF